MKNLYQLYETVNVSISTTFNVLLIHCDISSESKEFLSDILERANMEKKDIDLIITSFSFFTVHVNLKGSSSMTLTFRRRGREDLQLVLTVPLDE